MKNPLDIESQMTHMVEVSIRGYGDPGVDAARKSACPVHMYAGLLAANPSRDLGDGYYALQSMADIQFATRHQAVLQGSVFLGSDRAAIPLGLDGEEHRRYRHLLDPIFTAKAVAPLADSVRALAGDLIDGFLAGGRVEAWDHWCEPLPATIFLAIMGLPMEDRDDFIRFKNVTLSTGDLSLTADERMARRMEGVMWIHSYFNRNLDEREAEAEPRGDIIGQLLTAEVDGHRLTRQDVLDILGLFMIAGLDTVASALACFLSYFARHPEMRRRVDADRSLIRPAIEELMRFESPVVEGYRITVDDLTLPSGVEIPAGSFMHISWSAANIDPTVFDDPLTVNLDRSPNPHIGFASGYHRCLGSHLARMEMATALDVWFDRIPEFGIEFDQELEYTGNPRAPHHLPIVW